MRSRRWIGRSQGPLLLSLFLSCCVLNLWLNRSKEIVVVVGPSSDDSVMVEYIIPRINNDVQPFMEDKSADEKHEEFQFTLTPEEESMRLDPAVHVQRYVPRGQSFYYTDSASQRFGSFETWRPKEVIEEREVLEGTDTIFLGLITTSQTMWTTVPLQQRTLLVQFPHYGIYANVADRIGGKEVVDVLAETVVDLRQSAKEFEPYRVLRAIRDSHDGVGPDQVTISGMRDLSRFLLLPAILRAYTDYPHYEWYLFIDDDTSLFARNLRTALAELDSSEPLYLGSAVKGPKDLIFAPSGSAIALSAGAMKEVFGKRADVHDLVHREYAERAINEYSGDYMLALYLKEQHGMELDFARSSTMFQGSSITKVQLGANNWCSPIVSLGKQRLRDFKIVDEYMKLKTEAPILYSDIYLDFVKPYLRSTPQLNWDNGARDIELEPAVDSRAYPNAHKSVDACREACLNFAQCVMLRYDPYRQYCGLGISHIALGGPVLSYDSTSPDPNLCASYGIRCEPRGPGQSLTSMWFLPRIREIRRTLKCDILNEISAAKELSLVRLIKGKGGGTVRRRRTKRM